MDLDRLVKPWQQYCDQIREAGKPPAADDEAVFPSATGRVER
jgi:hypothetical protein